MKNVIYIILILQFFQNCYPQSPSDPLNVLFVGNSLTFFNNMPQTFEQLANEQGYHVTVDQHTPGGTGFVHHVTNNTLYQKFRDEVWDYVILQPGSNESPGFSFPIEETIVRGERLKDSILKYSPCASIHYYEISYGIVNDTPASFTQYQDRQTLIKNNLTQMANETDIPFVPVGECFRESMETDDSQFLWVNYGDIHPNAKGSYLAACSFYNGIFKQPIVNTSVLGGLTDADASYLRNRAEITTFDNLDDSLITTYTSTANFDYVINSETSISFTNTSVNFDSVHWDFGDDTTSTATNVTHEFNFSTNSSYIVVLTAYKDCREHHKILEVTANILDIEYFIMGCSKITLFPNPCKDILYIRGLLSSAHIYVYTITGNLVLEIGDYENENPINLKHLNPGIYLIKISTINNKTIRKIRKT